MDWSDIGGYVLAAVPGAVALWKTRHVASFESTLRKQEEAFRLAHSPRVNTAVKLWGAFCEYEITGLQYAQPEAPPRPAEFAGTPLPAGHYEQVAEWWAHHCAAGVKLAALYREAEVLLPAEVFEPFRRMYDRLTSATIYQHATEFTPENSERFLEYRARVATLCKQAQEERPAVVVALRKLIAGE